METRALLAAERFFPVPREDLQALHDSIARRPYPSLPPSLPQPQPAPDLGRLMQRYLLGLLSARMGDTAVASRLALELADEPASSRVAVARDVARGVRAEIARGNGNLEGALAELEGFQFDASEPGLKSLAHWGVHERFLKAEILLGLGRLEEALTWYQSFTGIYDAPFMAAAHVRSAAILSRMDRRERAAFHRGRAASIWRRADPELRALLAEGK
jgi:hypothetical protein